MMLKRPQPSEAVIAEARAHEAEVKTHEAEAKFMRRQKFEKPKKSKWFISKKLEGTYE